MTKKNVCLCGETESTRVFISQGYQLVRCVSCSLVRTVYGRHSRKKNFYSLDDLSIYIEKEHVFRTLFRRVIDYIKKYKDSGVFIDIGACVGLLVSEAKRAGFDAAGFEPSKHAVSVAQKKFGIRLIPKTYTEQSIKKSGIRHADIVILNHVLEHIEEPKQVLKNIVRHLKSHGLCVIGAPNFGSFLSYLKKGRWQSLIPDQHRWHFTGSTLDAFIIPYGFERIGMSTENHDRSVHPVWKRPMYLILDTIALVTGHGEAMLVVYKKTI